MERHYDAFISYRHAPLDMKVAADIQNSLERFPIPGSLQKRLGKKRIGPIFRDKEELPTTSSLSDVIQSALKNSDYLIVICSTSTVESIWVQREIEAFLQDHDRKHILTVLADGKPEGVIPDILCCEEVEVQDADGTVHVEARSIEPLSCDYRKKRSSAKREELPRLAAAILGCPYDELRQRQKRRRIRQTVSGLSIALLLVTAVAAFAINRAVVIARQAEQIEVEYSNALINQSRYLAQKSGELLEQGDRIGAIQVALAALPANEADNSRPLVTEALYALNNAVYPYHIPRDDEYMPKCILKTDGLAATEDKSKFSPSETRWLTIDKTGQMYVFDLKQDSRIAALTPRDVAPKEMGDTFLSADFVTEDRIILYLGAGAVCWDIQANCAVWTTEYASMDDNAFWYADTLVDSKHQALVAAFMVSGEELSVYQFDAATGTLQSVITKNELPVFAFSNACCHLVLSPDGTRAVVGLCWLEVIRDQISDSFPGFLMLVDLESKTYRIVSPQHADVVSLAFLSDNQVCLFTTDIAGGKDFNKDFPYAVELYNFEDGSLVWSTPGVTVIGRTLLDDFTPTSSIQFWSREPGNGNIQDLLIIHFGGLLLLLDPADGSIVQSESQSVDILNTIIYDNSHIYLIFRNGEMMKYRLGNQISNEIGLFSGQLRSVRFSTALKEFLLCVDDSPNIVVMSNQIEDTGGTTVDIQLADAYYAANSDREYRILKEYLYAGDGETLDGCRLRFYLPLTDTEVAVTDGPNDIDNITMYFSDKGEDICYYTATDSSYRHHTLCGWGIKSNQKVFEYSQDLYDGEILGLLDKQILYLEGGTESKLRFIDPVNGTEQVITLEDREHVGALSPDHKYVAVVTQNRSTNLYRLRLLDVEQGSWVDLPEELQALPCTEYTYSKDLSFSPDSSKLAVWTGDDIVILDLNTMTISQHVQIPCKEYGHAFFLNDHILLVYEDSCRFVSWDTNTQSVVMKDLYDDIPSTATVDIGNGYFQAEKIQSNVYTYDENGRFARYLTTPFGVVSPTGSEVLSFYNAYTLGIIKITGIRIYPMYTLDELIGKANEILDGRTLTEAERIQYFIDS